MRTRTADSDAETGGRGKKQKQKHDRKIEKVEATYRGQRLAAGEPRVSLEARCQAEARQWAATTRQRCVPITVAARLAGAELQLSKAMSKHRLNWQKVRVLV